MNLMSDCHNYRNSFEWFKSNVVIFQTRRFSERLRGMRWLCLALVASFIVRLTDFLTYSPFAIELTEQF